MKNGDTRMSQQPAIAKFDQIMAFIRQYLEGYKPFKTAWNYEDGCILIGCADLFSVTGDSLFRDFVLRYLEPVITPEGAVSNYPMDKYNIDSTNAGRALFFALDQTGDDRYRKAAEFVNSRLATHPRCACGNFWHKEIYPDQIWLDGLYMAQPFRVMYDMRYGGRQATPDVIRQFQNVKTYLYDPEKHLYYHACDLARQQFWADPVTGKSRNFWLRSMGWYLMALVDCIDSMDEALYEHRRVLIDLFRETVAGLLPYADPETGLYYQVIDQPEVPGNYLETSGSAMVIYALLKGARLSLLDAEATVVPALTALNRLTDLRLAPDEAGRWHLNGICSVAGLGPATQPRRDGSVAYYLSEPIVADDPKGVGAYFMALSEALSARPL